MNILYTHKQPQSQRAQKYIHTKVHARVRFSSFRMCNYPNAMLSGPAGRSVSFVVQRDTWCEEENPKFLILCDVSHLRSAS